MNSLKVLLILLLVAAALVGAFDESYTESFDPLDVLVAKKEVALAAKISPQGGPAPAVAGVNGCYPARDDTGKFGARRLFVCLLEMSLQGQESSLQKVPFYVENGEWKILIEALKSNVGLVLLCPTKIEGQDLLKRHFHDSGLQVTAGDDEGSFTDERGMSRDKPGPMRLMCTYSAKRSYGEITAIGYFQYSKDGYSLDSDVEVWND